MSDKLEHAGRLENLSSCNTRFPVARMKGPKPMRFLVKLSPAFLLCALLLLPSTAQADSVVINEGSLHVTSNITARFSFGNSGQGFAVSNGASSTDSGNLLACSPCVAGQTMSINAYFAGESILGSGAATVGGVNYSRLFYAGGVRLTGNPVIIPFDTSPLVTITVPFTLSGVLDGYETSMLNRPAIFSMMLNGQGTATLVLSSYFTGCCGQLYDFRSITYNFSPAVATPEPATLLLFGTGLAAVTARYRRHRKVQIKQ